MPAEVETMMYVREVPWHRLGTRVEEAPTSKEALELAGLDWTVNPLPIYDGKGNEIKGYKANTRSSDSSVLGIVGSKYTIVQNAEAFDFTDALIGEGVRYETAGSLRNGRTVWLLGKMPERYIVGDKFEPYLCFTNSHDGTSAIRVCMTPVRVVCANTLNMALNGAKRSWHARHTGNVNAKLEQARQTLKLADEYMAKLAVEAEKLADAKFTLDDARTTLDKMFPVGKDASDRQKKTAENAKEDILICMFRPDIAQFMNTKWGFMNAVSDYVGHAEPVRHTANFEENRWGSIIGGHPLLDKASALIGV